MKGFCSFDNTAISRAQNLSSTNGSQSPTSTLTFQFPRIFHSLQLSGWTQAFSSNCWAFLSFAFFLDIIKETSGAYHASSSRFQKGPELRKTTFGATRVHYPQDHILGFSVLPRSSYVVPATFPRHTPYSSLHRRQSSQLSP